MHQSSSAGKLLFLWLVLGPGIMPSDAESPRPELQPSRSGTVPLDLLTRTPISMALSVLLRSTQVF